MFRFIIPILLITTSIAGFLLFTNPMYHEINVLRDQVASYNEALSNSKALENERDKLTKKYNAINPEDLVKIKKFLPDNVDNIRLILEIEKVAMPYGMVLRDVKYDTTKKEDASMETGAVQPIESTQEANKEYGTWNLEFSTQGNYNNFINFVQDLEKNLRIVDVSSVEFSSEVGAGLNPSLAESYKYSFTIKTYWLKN
jgi:Tfp pilus assembly protein PilO